jgi:hypothetical protein
MPFGTDAVDGGFDAGVEQLDDHHQQHRARQHRHLDPALSDPEGQRHQHHGGDGLLPKRRFTPSRPQAGQREQEGMPDPAQADAAFLRVDVVVVHARLATAGGTK